MHQPSYYEGLEEYSFTKLDFDLPQYLSKYIFYLFKNDKLGIIFIDSMTNRD